MNDLLLKLKSIKKHKMNLDLSTLDHIGKSVIYEEIEDTNACINAIESETDNQKITKVLYSVYESTTSGQLFYTLKDFLKFK